MFKAKVWGFAGAAVACLLASAFTPQPAAAQSEEAAASATAGVEAWRDFATMAQVELLVIDDDTTVTGFEAEVRANQAYYRLAQGF